MTTYSDASAAYQTNDLLYDGTETPDVLLAIGDRRLDYVGGSLRVTHSLENRSVARMSVESDTELYILEGEEITLRLNGVLHYRGVLMRPVQHWPGPGNTMYEIEGTCFRYIPERRIIAKSYINKTAGEIIYDIVTQLADDGLEHGTIADGPLISEAVFSYVFASDAIDKLAAAAGFDWHVDESKRLHFAARGEMATAPFGLTEFDEYAGTVHVSRGNRDYRNRQFVRGGKAETDELVETWLGDGSQRTFVVGYPIAREPSLVVDGIPQTIAPAGIGDPSSQWFWTYGSNQITQNQEDTPVASDVEVVLTYIGLYDVMVVSFDAAAIQQRMDVENFGTGIVDNMVTDPSLRSAGLAFQFAAGSLDRYGTVGRSVSWETETSGLAVGQAISVDMPHRDLDDVTLVIQEVVVSDRAGRIVYAVRAVEGPDDGNWAGWFKKQSVRNAPITFRENIGEEESLILLASAIEGIGWNEDVTCTVQTCDTPNGQTTSGIVC